MQSQDSLKTLKSNSEQLYAAWAKFSRELQVLEGKYEAYMEVVNTTSEEIKATEEELDLLTATQAVLSSLEKEWYKNFENRVASIISRGLSFVFGEKLDFIIERSENGNSVVINFKLAQVIDGESLITDIIDAKGGGVISVAGFLLRVLVLLSSNQLEKVMLLDETFAHLSSEYVPNLALLLQKLNEETGIQFLIITHDPTLIDYADVAYEASQYNGDTVYEKLQTRREYV